jgi:hypothetical protein
MGEDLGRLMPQPGVTAVPFEEGQADPALEFGEALGES